MKPNTLTPTILACDDVETCGHILKLVVKGMGPKVVTTTRKAKAIALLSKVRPAIVTTDLTPDLGPDGTDAFDLIRAVKMYDTRITVIIISGSLTPARRKRARQLGADHCFRKTFDVIKLQDTVSKGLKMVEL